MKYWKVHRRNIKHLLKGDQELIDAFECGSCCLMQLSHQKISNSSQCDGDGYMFFSFFDNNAFGGFMYYTQHSINWYKDGGYKYMGEYNCRKEKLKKLNSL